MDEGENWVNVDEGENWVNEDECANWGNVDEYEEVLVNIDVIVNECRNLTG